MRPLRREDMLMLRESPTPVEIRISSEKVSFIIVKAREFDVAVDTTGSQHGLDMATAIVKRGGKPLFGHAA